MIFGNKKKKRNGDIRPAQDAHTEVLENVMLPRMSQELFRRLHPDAPDEEYLLGYWPNFLLGQASTVMSLLMKQGVMVSPATKYVAWPLDEEYEEWLGGRPDTDELQSEYFCQMEDLWTDKKRGEKAETLGLAYTDLICMLPVLNKNGNEVSPSLPLDCAYALEEYLDSLMGHPDFSSCVIPCLIDTKTAVRGEDQEAFRRLAAAKFTHGQRARLGRYFNACPSGMLLFIPVIIRETHPGGLILGEDLMGRGGADEPDLYTDRMKARLRISSSAWLSDAFENYKEIPGLYDGCEPLAGSEYGNRFFSGIQQGREEGSLIPSAQVIPAGKIRDAVNAVEKGAVDFLLRDETEV